MKRIGARLAAAAFWFLYGVALLILAPGALLIAIHETVSGLLCGILFAVVLLIPAVLFAGRRFRAPAVIRRAAMVILPGSAMILAGSLFTLTPPTSPVSGSLVRSLVSGGQHYREHRLWNLLPEGDQVKLGITLAPLFDPVIDRPQARRILGATLPLYRGMEVRPEFGSLGSVLHFAYADLLGLPPATVGHYFLVQPPGQTAERLPAVIFLHGGGGNFKVYPWLWCRFLAKREVLAACPTFGSGNWERPGGIEAIERVWRDLVKDGAADPDRIYLVALSNGGRVLARSGAAAGLHFRGLIGISAYLEEEVLSAQVLAGGWKEKPILLIHGKKDDRIPVSVADHAARILEAAGSRVTLRIYPEEDHFLLFSVWDEVLAAIAAWMREVEGR
jgi:pimeloyl-ACP methyl ester carboxylesterase